jgi:hypothetical protein
MVHPLLGYVHKDLALVSCIMIVLHFSAPRAYNSPQNWVRSMRGELDHTRLHGLWSNPQIHLSLGLLFSTAYNLVRITQNITEKSLTTTNDLLYMILLYISLYISGSSASFRILQKP